MSTTVYALILLSFIIILLTLTEFIPEKPSIKKEKLEEKIREE